jgi:hypothetical protein
MAALQLRGVILPGVQLGGVSTLLQGCNTPRQEIKQYHHRRQALIHQELDPLEHEIICPLQIGNLPPEVALTYRGTGWQLQLVVEIGLYNHPVLPPVVPFVGPRG